MRHSLSLEGLSVKYLKGFTRHCIGAILSYFRGPGKRHCVLICVQAFLVRSPPSACLSHYPRALVKVPSLVAGRSMQGEFDKAAVPDL